MAAKPTTAVVVQMQTMARIVHGSGVSCRTGSMQHGGFLFQILSGIVDHSGHSSVAIVIIGIVLFKDFVTTTTNHIIQQAPILHPIVDMGHDGGLENEPIQEALQGQTQVRQKQENVKGSSGLIHAHSVA